MTSSLISLVGGDIELTEEEESSRETLKWSTFVNGKDGFLYGIPWGAHHVVKFNPVDKSMRLIGAEVDGAWYIGILAHNGCIYSEFSSQHGSRRMLKINTVDGTVETLDETRLRAQEFRNREWLTGAVGPDNCIYYLPGFGHDGMGVILRLDPDTDTLCSILVPNLGMTRFRGSVLGNDNCIYGLPHYSTSKSTRIMRFDPVAENISFYELCSPGGEFNFATGGILGCDGNIYALNDFGQLLKLDTSVNTLSLIGDHLSKDGHYGDEIPIIGIDQCIYWPPCSANQVLKFDPGTQEPPSLVGPTDLNPSFSCRWVGGARADDGVIYCVPFEADQVLAIDPLRELSATMKKNARLNPEELGRLFVQESDELGGESLFKSAVRKFGNDITLKLLDECLLAHDDRAAAENGNPCHLDHSNSSEPRFIVAASSGNGGVSAVPLTVIYHLVRRDVHILVGFVR